MSRTTRRPPPRSRLRAGYAHRLCWRCRYPVRDCSCPARDLVRAPSVDDPKIVDEEFVKAMLPWSYCQCEWCLIERPLQSRRTPTLTQLLAALLEEPLLAA